MLTATQVTPTSTRKASSLCPFQMRAIQILCLALVQSSYAGPLDCADESDPLVKTCCSAQSAWSSMEAAGGCGGSGATAEQCSQAAELCERCRTAVEGHRDAPADGVSLEQKLGSTGVEAEADGTDADGTSEFLVGQSLQRGFIPQVDTGGRRLQEIGNVFPTMLFFVVLG